MSGVATAIRESLRITRGDGGYVCTQAYLIASLSSAGTGLALLATAINASGLPIYGDSFAIDGRTVWVRNIDYEPWGDTDGQATVTWQEQGNWTVPGIATLEVTTSLEQAQTDFDATNRALAIPSRVPLIVYYNPLTSAATTSNPQSGSVSLYIPRYAFNYTIKETTDPSATAAALVGKTNSGTFHGLAAGTVLCTEISGRYESGWYSNRYSFAYDPADKWQQILRWKRLDGTYPSLSNAQIAASNGLLIVTPQGSASYASLPYGVA
jgi:hypothetical protein